MAILKNQTVIITRMGKGVKMRILAYRGISIISKLIKFQTRSIHSHIGIQLNDGSVVEAWQNGGVRRIENPQDGHKLGTDIDVYRIRGFLDEEAATAYLYGCIGQKYDYSSVARFVTRRKATDNTKKFCSELAELAMREGGLNLLNGNPSEHSPRDTALSPYLEFLKTI